LASTDENNFVVQDADQRKTGQQGPAFLLKKDNSGVSSRHNSGSATSLSKSALSPSATGEQDENDEADNTNVATPNDA
jgi:hypothetical protein